jgi:hypothetical protein
MASKAASVIAMGIMGEAARRRAPSRWCGPEAAAQRGNEQRHHWIVHFWIVHF